jgi:hypothetical protein
MLKPHSDKTAKVTKPASQPAFARRKMAPKSAQSTSSFFIEGDDQIIDFDASAGVIATRTGRTFLIEKAGAEASALQERDLPLRIHYRCDQMQACTITTAGAGIWHTRLRK